MFRAVDIIQKKRDGSKLTTEEIDFFIKGFSTGKIPDYQMSAMLMAIFFSGMNEREIVDLTMVMARSGEMVNLSSISGIKVDKHSTGGVGDTTTLVLAPLMAAIGVPIAKISGRGLGFTGGTLDKYEAIPNFAVEMSESEFVRSVQEIGVAVIGQSKALVPSDHLLYALRDVTATVDSIPLIASSVMSKKIASGAEALVLDVTVGDGAFMKNIDEARKLAKMMVRIGCLARRNTVTVISDMNEPLGQAVGNALEVVEAIETLKGDGPKDLEELVFALGSQMALLAKVVNSAEEAVKQMRLAINNGYALEKFKQMIINQKGDPLVIEKPKCLLTAPYKINYLAKQSGYIEKIKTEEIGLLAMKLGAGRKVKTDVIDPSVGFYFHKKRGDKIEKGKAILTIYANNYSFTDIMKKLDRCFKIGKKKIKKKLIYEVIGENDMK
ncbi:MAG: pyrimidine-nucleoside phosphorylase [Lactobacillales bacterium]|nr:pyrimidine-nucleoside phosphorylase [Lactobacillales bacterium]